MKKPDRYDETYWIHDFIFLERKYGADRRVYLKERGPLEPDEGVRRVFKIW